MNDSKDKALLTSQDAHVDAPKRVQQLGLTLIEIIIVLGLVGGLIALLGGRIVGGVDRANVKKTQVILGDIETRLEDYRLDCGDYPPSGNLKALVEDPGGSCPDYMGPYVEDENALKDAWGQEIIYEIQDGRPVLKSLGADKRPGGSSTDKDITN